MSLAKKVIIAFVIFLTLIAIILSAVPFFVDLNREIKPLLITSLSKNLHAQVTMGDVSLTVFGKVNLKIDFLKITKEKVTVEISDLKLMMPYSVLLKNPVEWVKNTRMKISADEVSLNNRALVLTDVKSDFFKEDKILKFKNTKFRIFDGKAESYAQLDFTDEPKGLCELVIRDGVWPAERLKNNLASKVLKIPKARALLSKIDINEKFETLTGKFHFQSGITNIESLSMKIPEDKVEAKASGTINSKNLLNIDGFFFLPLENIPKELQGADGRAKIPFEIIGTIRDPKVNWEKTIEVVTHAYAKDEGKKIIKKELDKLKEKLMKDEKVREFIKGIKF